MLYVESVYILAINMELSPSKDVYSSVIFLKKIRYDKLSSSKFEREKEWVPAMLLGNITGKNLEKTNGFRNYTSDKTKPFKKISIGL